MLGAAVLTWEDRSGAPAPSWLPAAAAAGQAIRWAILLAGSTCAVIAAFAMRRLRRARLAPPTYPDGFPVPLVR